MANGDIVDVMFGWIFQLFGWIFGGLIKLVMWIIGGIFNLIVAGVKALCATKKEV